MDLGLGPDERLGVDVVDLEGGKQCRGAIALVIVTMTAQCTAVRELQIALRTLQRLDRGLFVDADDNRVLGRRPCRARLRRRPWLRTRHPCSRTTICVRRG